MNWQLISFFGDSTVLLPSAAALFIVLMLRKTSRLLAWQWSLLFGITGAIVCASKLAFMGWGLGIRKLDYTGFSGHSALRGLLAYLSVAAQRSFFRGLAKSSRRHRLYSGRRGGLFAAGHPCAFRLGSDCWPAAGRCWQRFVPAAAKTHF
ncbi:PAP2 family protein [Klebsiella pneumoniae]|nr:PAP2 family protein [Klebsiella pneumoniae]VUI52006.1 PAP2 family protein [Klebsiella pneumoniae]